MFKFCRLVLCISLLCLAFSGYAFADTVTDSAIEEPSIFEADASGTGLTVIVNNDSVNNRLQALEDSIDSIDSSSDSSQAVYDNMQLMSVNVSSERVSASDANGFKAVLLGLMGDYETVITDYTYSNGSYTSHSIDITPDWSWIASAGVFALVVFCCFRLVGGILCNR